MAVNRELAQKVLDQINRDPQSLDMNSWEDWAYVGDEYYDPEAGEYALRTECGTTRCGAGWAIHIWASENEINTNRNLMRVMSDVARRRDIRIPAYDTVGRVLLGLKSSEVFYFQAESFIDVLESLIRDGDESVWAA